MSKFASNPIISADILEFHTGAFPVEIFSNPDERFGTLSITVSKTKKTEKPVYIQCTIDSSDSMSDRINKYSRLDYVKRTIAKMFEFLVENVEAELWIHVDSFSNDFITEIDTVLLTKENVEEIIKKIMSLKTWNTTNIELALNSSDKIMSSMIQSNPQYNAIHLFLTDGDATCGSTSVDTLVKLVNPEYTNIFIGYGAEHNATLLSKCANKTLQNKYLFVDYFENTGVVYGEIIHTLLYSAVKDVSITMSPNTSIYDATTNQWVQTLLIPALLSEKEHLYHVKSSAPQTSQAILEGTIQNQLDDDNLSIEITGDRQILSHIDTLPDLVDEDDYTIIEPVNLSKYIFRQRTMELLYAASKVNRDNKSIVNLKKLLKDFFKEMRLYMEANDLSEDTFMKILCEDIHLSYVTLGTSEGYMLSESRNTSQRQQTLYRCGSDSCQIQRPNHITRQNAVVINDCIQQSYSIQNYHYDEENIDEEICDNENVDEDEYTSDPNDPNDIENYNTAFIKEDIYSTQETIEITRAVSS
jgi:hypothetical protein